MGSEDRALAKAIYLLALAVTEQTGKTHASYELRDSIRDMKDEFKDD